MKRTAQMLTLLMVVVFALAGCGRRNPAPTPTAPAATAAPTTAPTTAAATAAPTTAAATTAPTAAPTTAAPTAVPTSAPASGEPADVDLTQLSGLETLDTYRSSYSVVYDGVQDGTPVTQTVELSVTVNRTQMAAHTTTSTSSSKEEAGAAEAFEMIQIGTQRWAKFDGAWGPLGVTESTRLDELAPSISELISNTTDLRLVGTETINGVNATHYQFGLESMPADVREDMGEVESLLADLWVTVENPFIIKFQFVMDGPALNLGEDEPALDGTANLLYEVYDINADITIEEPEVGAPTLDGFAEGELPLMADATIETAGFGIVTYATAESVADVTSFYQEQLTALGWTEQEGGMTSDTFVSLDFVKENVTLTLNVSTGETEGQTKVTMYTSVAEGEGSGD